MLKTKPVSHHHNVWQLEESKSSVKLHDLGKGQCSIHLSAAWLQGFIHHLTSITVIWLIKSPNCIWHVPQQSQWKSMVHRLWLAKHVGPVNVLYIIMFKIRKIKPNSGSVREKPKSFHGDCLNMNMYECVYVYVYVYVHRTETQRATCRQ